MGVGGIGRLGNSEIVMDDETVKFLVECEPMYESALKNALSHEASVLRFKKVED